MPWFAKLVIGIEVAFAVFCLFAIIYFIDKRIRDKKKETFEKRKN